MARLAQCGFELNSLTAGVEVDSIGIPAAISLSTTVVRSGVYSAKFNPTAQAPRLDFFLKSSNQSAGMYARIYLRVDVLDASTAMRVMSVLNVAGTAGVSVRLSTAGGFQLYKSDGTQLGSDSAPITTGRWYRVELKNDSTSATGVIEARFFDCGTSGVDPGGAGTTIASGNNSAQGTWGRLRVGNSAISNTATYYVDDFAVNDSTGGSQNTWCGSGKIIHLRPDAAGDANGFLVNVGGTAGAANNFTRVNESPPDDATSYNASAALNAEDLFNCGASGIGSGDTVNVVAVGIRLADLVSADATAAIKAEIEKTTGGTKTQSAAIVANSTSFVSNPGQAGASDPVIVTYTDPDGAAWTQTTLDSLQAGYIETIANVQAIAVTALWVSVDYTPTIYIIAALTGSGSLSATVTPYQRISPSLAGSGTLSATITPYQRFSASIAGGATVAATVTPYQRFAVSVAGSASLTASVTPYQRVTPSISGQGVLTAQVTPHQRISVTIAAGGSVSASLTAYQRMTPSIAGTSSLSATLTPYQRIAPSVAGAATITATVTPYQRIVPSIAGRSTLTAGVTVTKGISPNIHGVATVTAAIVPYRLLTPALSGFATVTSHFLPKLTRWETEQPQPGWQAGKISDGWEADRVMNDWTTGASR